MTVKNYLVSVTFNETINGPVWLIEPSRLVVDAADAAIYFTWTSLTAPDTSIAFSWQVVSAPVTTQTSTNPFQTVVTLTNEVTETQTLAYRLWADIEHLVIVSHDPEIVLEPPHP
ncbi:MAG: hypothetical protein JO197_19875 [Acidobacteria bacterium]|nr:hypothetical protein [Acidobacteriota bacterium]MBV9478619.1 hypothetical protein [Acidobacteriota bacterium]